MPRLPLPLLIGLCSLPAFASDLDETEPAVDVLPVSALPAPATDAAVTLDEVVVTARRRLEVTQKIPVSLSVLDGDTLASAGLVRLQDMQQQVPNLVVSVPNTRLSSYTIRGLGSTSFNDGMESSVGLFLDGIYLGRQGMSVFDLIDLERVEVLRGPQGTLYGKNTTAGAINISTRKPQHAFEALADTSLGSDGFRQYRGSVTGALFGSDLAGRLTAYSTRRDGHIENINPNGPPVLNDWNKDGVRGQLLWEPGGSLSGRLIAEYGRQDERCCVFLSSDHGTLVPLRDAAVGYERLPADPFARRVDNDADTQTHVRQKALSAEVNIEFDHGTLTSLSGWRDWHFMPINEDGSGLDITPLAGVINDHRQLSQELRYSAAGSDKFHYTVGLFYLHQQLDGLERVFFGADAAAWNSREAVLRNAGAARPIIEPSVDRIVVPGILDGARRLTTSEQTSDSGAIFGQFSWRPLPALEITPGLRYTRERKRAVIVRNLEGLVPYAGLQPGCGLDLICHAARPQAYENLRLNALGGLENGEVYRYAGRVDEDAWTGQLAVSYSLTDDLLGYGSLAQGVKAGGINIGVVREGAEPTFRPEKASTAELGLKSQFWQRRAQFNAAIYHTDVRDYQALTYTPGTEIATVPDNLLNVGKVRIQGVEADLTLRPLAYLGLRLGVAYNRAKYREFPNAPAAPENTPLPPAPPALQDLAGEDLYNSPRWTATSGLDYRHPLAFFDGELYSGLDYAWRSDYYASLERGRGSHVDAHGILNLRLGLRHYSGRWDVHAWVRNALDEDYTAAVLATQGTGTYGVLPGDPRTWGLTLRGNFH